MKERYCKHKASFYHWPFYGGCTGYLRWMANRTFTVMRLIQVLFFPVHSGWKSESLRVKQICSQRVSRESLWPYLVSGQQKGLSEERCAGSHLQGFLSQLQAKIISFIITDCFGFICPDFEISFYRLYSFPVNVISLFMSLQHWEMTHDKWQKTNKNKTQQRVFSEWVSLFHFHTVTIWSQRDGLCLPI